MQLCDAIINGSKAETRIVLHSLIADTDDASAAEECLNQAVDTAALSKGIDLNFNGAQRVHLVHLLAFYSTLAQLERFLKLGLNPSVTDDRGRTALHYACQSQRHRNLQQPSIWYSQSDSENVKKVTYLLNLPCLKANAQDCDGDTPLHAAAVAGNYELMEVLVKQHGSDVTLMRNNQGYTAMHAAAVLGHTDSVTALHALIGDIDLPTSTGETCLHLAARHGKAPTVYDLCKMGANVEARDDVTLTTPLLVACARGKYYAMDALIMAGADVNARDAHGRTALHMTVRNRRSRCFQTLIKQTAVDVNDQDSDGDSALHLAAQCEANDYVWRLCHLRGASVNALNKSHSSALHLACREKRIGAVTTLLQHGADTSVADDSGDTALHIASRLGHADIIKHLLLFMPIASVNMRNNVGQTALHVAVTHRQAASVALLTSHATCDVIAQDADHRTALRMLVMVYEPGTHHGSSCCCADDDSCSCYTAQTTTVAAILRLLLRRSLPVVHARRRVCSLNN